MVPAKKTAHTGAGEEREGNKGREREEKRERPMALYGSRQWPSVAAEGWRKPSWLGSPDGAATTSEKERGGDHQRWEDGTAKRPSEVCRWLPWPPDGRSDAGGGAKAVGISLF